MLGAYSASKFVLEGCSESLRIETHSLGIRVAIIEPGAFETDIRERNIYIGEQAQHPSSSNRERSQRFAEFVKGSAKHRHDAGEVARLILRSAPRKTYERLVGQGSQD